MRKYLVLLATAMIFTSCGEYQRVLKSNDANYRLDYAKRAFEAKKYTQAKEVYLPDGILWNLWSMNATSAVWSAMRG